MGLMQEHFCLQILSDECIKTSGHVSVFSCGKRETSCTQMTQTTCLDHLCILFVPKVFFSMFEKIGECQKLSSIPHTCHIRMNLIV